MANVRNGNTYFIDTASVSLSDKNLMVVGIIITATSAAGQLVLGDDNSAASYPKKINIKIPDATTSYFRLDGNGILFPNGIRVTTVTNCEATLILKVQQGS